MSDQLEENRRKWVNSDSNLGGKGYALYLENLPPSAVPTLLTGGKGMKYIRKRRVAPLELDNICPVGQGEWEHIFCLLRSLSAFSDFSLRLVRGEDTGDMVLKESCKICVLLHTVDRRRGLPKSSRKKAFLYVDSSFAFLYYILRTRYGVCG